MNQIDSKEIWTWTWPIWKRTWPWPFSYFDFFPILSFFLISIFLFSDFDLNLTLNLFFNPIFSHDFDLNLTLNLFFNPIFSHDFDLNLSFNFLFNLFFSLILILNPDINLTLTFWTYDLDLLNLDLLNLLNLRPSANQLRTWPWPCESKTFWEKVSGQTNWDLW